MNIELLCQPSNHSLWLLVCEKVVVGDRGEFIVSGSREICVVQVRERKKAEKRDRIRIAALKLFAERGYDATTLRDVAREAHVALGTLSLYAADKRDLTLLVFNEITVATAEKSIDLVRDRELPLEDRIVTFFTPFFEDWASNPRLARIFLQVNYYSGGMHGEEYKRTRRALIRQVEILVEDAIDRGEIAPRETTDMIAHVLFLTFSAAARWWIAGDDPVLDEGLAYLRRLTRIQIVGMGPSAQYMSMMGFQKNGSRAPARGKARGAAA